MAVLSEKDRQQIVERLQQMQQPVKLVHFTQELDCELCRMTLDLLQDVAQLSDNISLEVYNFQLDKAKVAEYRVDKVPATVVQGEKDYGIRFYGLPAGYEFITLLEDILQVSSRESGLSPENTVKLSKLTEPMHLEVFVTPTCPYCPAAARLAHQLAIESDLITADMVEATEYPDLVRRYEVRGVPKTVINQAIWIDGSLPEADFIDQVLEGAGVSAQAPREVST